MESKHSPQAEHIKSIVYGGMDGTITTFAVVAGAAGAGLEPRIALIMGFSSLAADAISMAVGDFASSRAQMQLDDSESIKEHYQDKGFSKKTASQIQKQYQSERISFSNTHKPLGDAISTFFSFVVFGAVPLLAYIFSYFFVLKEQFLLSIGLTALTLFVLGAYKAKIIHRDILRNGFETLGIGGFAAVAAYSIGLLVSLLI